MSGESGGGGPQASPRLQLPPPKPPRQTAAEAAFTGEYLYTRLERPAGPAPAARTLPPPRAAPLPSPYDNVPLTAAAARAAAAAAAAAQDGEQPAVCSTVRQLGVCSRRPVVRRVHSPGALSEVGQHRPQADLSLDDLCDGYWTRPSVSPSVRYLLLLSLAFRQRVPSSPHWVCLAVNPFDQNEFYQLPGGLVGHFSMRRSLHLSTLPGNGLALLGFLPSWRRMRLVSGVIDSPLPVAWLTLSRLPGLLGTRHCDCHLSVYHLLIART